MNKKPKSQPPAKKATVTKTPVKKSPSKKVGRPRKTTSEGSKIPDHAMTISAASKVWNLPISEIRRAKNAGCQAFKSNRIYRDELIGWLSKNPRSEDTDGETKESLEMDRLRAQIQQLRMRIAKERDTLLDAETAISAFREAGSIFQAEAQSRMPREVYVSYCISCQSKIRSIKFIEKGLWDFE